MFFSNNSRQTCTVMFAPRPFKPWNLNSTMCTLCLCVAFYSGFPSKEYRWGGELEQILGLPLKQHRHRCLVSEETIEPWLQLPKAAHETFRTRVYGKAVMQKREVESGVFGVTLLGCWQPQTAHCCKPRGFPACFVSVHGFARSAYIHKEE